MLCCRVSLELVEFVMLKGLYNGFGRAWDGGVSVGGLACLDLYAVL